MRAGYAGALAAWMGFTLPSAALLVLFAYGAGALGGAIGGGLLHGLKLVAVAIVAQAVLGMAHTLCPDRERASIAVGATLTVLLTSTSIAQIAAIGCGAAAGLILCCSVTPPQSGNLQIKVSRSVSLASLVSFIALLAGLPLLRDLFHVSWLDLFDAFYRSGALVFGGGHVVLPLLREAFVAPGWVTDEALLAGYGAAQAVPGPLFTFAAYLGAIAEPTQQLIGAALGLMVFSCPGFWCCSGRCRGGPNCAGARELKPRCAASMQQSLVYWVRLSTTRCGSRRLGRRRISRLLWSASLCFRSGVRPRSSSSF